MNLTKISTQLRIHREPAIRLRFWTLLFYSIWRGTLQIKHRYRPTILKNPTASQSREAKVHSRMADRNEGRCPEKGRPSRNSTFATASTPCSSEDASLW